MVEIDYPAGSELITQGKAADAVYFLRDGAVKIVVNDEMVAMIDKDQCFGEMSCLIPNTEASATVTTLKESKILKIEKNDFLKSVENTPKLWKTLFLQMANRVQRVNGRLSEVLHHSPQGLIKVDQQGVISKDYSIQCTNYLKSPNLTGQKFQDLLFEESDSRKKDWFDYFQLMFSNHMMSFEDISQLLLSEIAIPSETSESKIYKLTYFPCFDDDGVVIAVDIGMEDITLQRELELLNEQMEQEQAILKRVYENPDTFLSVLDLLRGIREEIDEALASDNPDEKIKQESKYIMRKLHNAKGLSGLFEISYLKSSCHNLESYISNLSAVDSEFKEKYEIFRSSSDRVEKILEEINDDLKRRLLGVCLERKTYEDLLKTLSSKDLAAAIEIVQKADSVDLLKVFELWPEQVERISGDLGKSVMIKISGPSIHIPKEMYSDLDSCLIHLLRNSLDHGLETDEERTILDKPLPSQIHVTIESNDSCFKIHVGDDGRGIDYARVKEKAIKSNVVSERNFDKMVSEGTAWKVLFEAGFSSKENVTDLSGRGVGLDSIKTVVNKYNGQISVSTELNKGTSFTISFPA